jgi:hypothetical protein
MMLEADKLYKTEHTRTTQSPCQGRLVLETQSNGARLRLMLRKQELKVGGRQLYHHRPRPLFVYHLRGEQCRAIFSVPTKPGSSSETAYDFLGEEALQVRTRRLAGEVHCPISHWLHPFQALNTTVQTKQTMKGV